MTMDANRGLRLAFLARVVAKEIRYLQQTDGRLFDVPLDVSKVKELENDLELAERVDAFVSRFGRLQDTVAEKLLPVVLDALGEKPGAMIDNLNRAEQLGLLGSAEQWMALRDLRNRMVHEYIEDTKQLVDALNKGHQHVAALVEDASRILDEIQARGWV
ncbi:MAG: hypothetical protein IBX49_11480 [Gammaproteobacteria bacterium]|nr:hypothetical protein [Gammaproteobacteria bacterium]